MSAEQHANKNQPAIRFKGFSGEWEENTIGSIGTFYYGKSAPKWSLSNDAPTPCVRYGELYTKFGATIFETLSKTNIDPKKLRFSKGHEVLVPRVGEKPEDFGKSCSYLPLKDVAIGEMISVYETSQNPLFYTYYFHTMYMEFANAVEGKNVKNLYYRELEPLRIYKPHKKEQTQIGECFQQLDRLIAQHQNKHDKLNNIKKALLKKMFPQQGASQPQIRFKGFSAEWEEKALGEISNTTIGEFVIKSKQNPNSPYPVFNGGKSYTGFYDEYNNEGNKILISARGANAGFINLQTKRYWAGNSCYSVEIFKTNSSLFLYYEMKRKESVFTDFQQAANIPSVSLGDVNKFPVTLPRLEEQTQIGNFFQQLDTLIKQQQTQLTKLNNVKQALLSKMFV